MQMVMSYSRSLWIARAVLQLLLLSWGVAGQNADLFLSLRGTSIDNDSFVDVDDIGNNDNVDNGTGLLCHINATDCCKSDQTGAGGQAEGVWSFPNGTDLFTVYILDGGTGFGRDREQSVVRLFRFNNPPERGRFSCELRNVTIYANILDIGQVSISPSAPMIFVGQAVNLQCSVVITVPAGTPTPEFEWFFGQTFNQPLPSTTTNSGSTYASTYSITSASESDGGMYTCRLRGNQRTAVNTMVTVQQPTATVSITASGTNTAGETYRLVCSVTVTGSTNPPTITWSGPMNNTVPSEMVNTTGSMSTLTFNPLSVSHAGTYTCKATAGSLSDDDMLTVQVNIPEITGVVTPSSNSSLTLGQTGFSLTCDVSGTDNLNSSTLVYEWQRNGGVLSNQRERTLSLSPLSGSHVGEYVCKVTVNSTLLSSVEMRTSGTHTVSAQIPIPTSIRVTSDQANSLAVRPVGSTVTLTCTVELSPSVDVPVTVNTVWTGPDNFNKTIMAQQMRSITTYTSTALVSSFGRDQSGNYTCTATVNSTALFIENSAAESGGSRVTVGVYVTQNNNVLANNSAVFISEVGSDVNNRLQCVTDRMPCCASPNVAGNWFFPDDGGGVPSLVDATESFGRTRGSDGTVNLHRLNIESMTDVMMPTGLYCCVVPDATGVDQWACVNIGCPRDTYRTNNQTCRPCPDNTNLTMSGGDVTMCPCLRGYYRALTEGPNDRCSAPPDACRDIHVQGRGSENITLSWSRPRNTGRDDYYYIIEYSDGRTTGQHSLVDGMGRIEESISGLRPDTEYTFTVTVQNEVSDQDERNELLRQCEISTRTEEGLPSPPTNVEAFCAAVGWRFPQSPNGRIMLYDIQLMLPGQEQLVMLNSTFDGTFVAVPEEYQVYGATMRVRARTMVGPGAWTEIVDLGCKEITETACPPCDCSTTTPPSSDCRDILYFTLGASTYHNNSHAPFSNVGEGNDALLCRTNNTDCCSTEDYRFGEFYYPNGTQVPIYGDGAAFYRNRGNSLIRLNHRGGGPCITGTFRCEILDASGTTRSIFITLF